MVEGSFWFFLHVSHARWNPTLLAPIGLLHNRAKIHHACMHVPTPHRFGEVMLVHSDACSCSSNIPRLCGLSIYALAVPCELLVDQNVSVC